HRLLAALALFASPRVALSDVLTQRSPVELPERPPPKRPVVVTLPAGTDVTLLDEKGKWIELEFQGARYYASSVQVANASPSFVPGPDPTCDYGYPYSGSGLFFARPLAQLRHSEPLGFLFGYHRYYPC
ncbi:MAG: hypothetical protein ACKOEC_07120, partial [Acidimicrobiia bacterium]